MTIDTSTLGIVLTGVSLIASILVVLMPRVAARIRGQRVIRMHVKGRRPSEERSVSVRRPIDGLLWSLLRLVDLSGQTFDRRVHILRRLRSAGLPQGRVNLFILSKILSPILFAVAASLFVEALYGVGRWQAAGVGVVAAVLGYWMPDVWLTNTILRRQMRIRRNWPDALDLLHMCMRSGMGLEAALTKVAREMRPSAPDIADEFVLTVSELNYLQSRRAALENLADRTGLPAVREVVTALIQSQKYGASIAGTLQMLARENRARRFSEAEKKAAALPPRLTVPMIVFFLPALFAVIIAPAFINFSG
ncbi:type II secretion system F family protein [Roseicyclus persicicus]|uniref:Type II secretion system F family protein n=1 Tax=Roseicyclus persicicus TaxID=2650661 RepID=A0A7X6GXN6_9RHOB|nr:type II secretion system F family protein [Roseibacterium persicicum]NKX43196.1 type II secretion system F family protein [Roseibacterium persicicum]